MRNDAEMWNSLTEESNRIFVSQDGNGAHNVSDILSCPTLAQDIPANLMKRLYSLALDKVEYVGGIISQWSNTLSCQEQIGVTQSLDEMFLSRQKACH
jgi:hypothetical protein